MINVEVSKNSNENSLGLLRRFTKRVQGSGVLPRLRGARFSSRNISENVKKKKTLKYLNQKKVTKELIKMGKMPEKTRRNGKRR